MKSYAKTRLVHGLFQCDVALFDAAESRDVKGMLDSICKKCSTRPKMSVNCPNCGEKYSSWFGLKKGFPKQPKDHEGPWNYKVVLTDEEVQGTKEDKTPIEVVKVVPLSEMAKRFAIEKTYFLLPDEKTVEGDPSTRLYQLYVSALDREGICLLAMFAIRGSKKRYAIVSNKEKGILLALKIEDMKQVPYDVANTRIEVAEQKQIDSFFDNMKTNDAAFPAPEDKLLKMLQNALKKSDGEEKQKIKEKTSKKKAGKKVTKKV